MAECEVDVEEEEVWHRARAFDYACSTIFDRETTEYNFLSLK